MFKNSFLLFFFFLLPYSSFAQKITGVVVNQITQEPLIAAHVFLNNFSKGTNTDTQGRFELNGLQAGNYDLIVSFVGYKTFAQTVKVENDLNLKIELSPQALVLEEVTVEDDKDWKTHYETFLRDFLGNTPNSRFCKIKNPDVLRIKYEADSGFLRVRSDEPLLIENKALGYEIRYFLTEYRREFGKTNYMSYYGFIFFEEMKSQNPKKAKNGQKIGKKRGKVRYSIF